MDIRSVISISPGEAGVTVGWHCDPRERRGYSPATARARSKTSSSIAPVTRPVKVFC